MSGITTDTDAMSGIEPLAPGSSVEVSPAPGEHNISARSSANTAELLASTLYSVEPVSDPEDTPRQGPAALSTGSQGAGLLPTYYNQNPQWRDEDGQTVSSILSPLSIDDRNTDVLTKGGRYVLEQEIVNRSLLRNGRNQQIGGGNQGGGSRPPHLSSSVPRSILVQPDGVAARSSPYQLDRHNDSKLEDVNQTVLDRRRDFVSKFGSQGTDRRGVAINISHPGGTKIAGSPVDLNSDLSVSDQLQLKDYEEQRLSADSTLTEHLLRGITPTDHISPFGSAPYDSGLPPNLQSLNVGTKSHTAGMQSESYLVQENLEKERYRRKHCELQIRELHSKLMESQQLLAVAEATRKKKDSMIEQIEKNFSKVMSDWKAKDREKLESLDRLKRDVDKYQHIARMREQELTVREKENTELRLSKESLQTELVQVREESSSELEEQREKMKVTISEMEHAVQERVAAEQHIKKVQDMLAKERSGWREKEAGFTERLAGLEDDISKKHKEFQRTLEKESEAARQLISENDERRKRIAQLQDQLSKTLQEKESLSLEMSLKEAQFEAALQKQEMDWKEQMERLIQERTASVQEDSSRQLEDQQASHRAQLTEMAGRHQEELRRLHEEHSGDRKMMEERYRSSQEQLQQELDQSNQKINRLSSKLEEVQRHRSLIIQKLQTCLQSYANDSLMMLGQLNSSPATSNTRVYSQGTEAAPPKSGLPPTTDRRHSVDQQFIQLMSTLSSDVGYQSLASNVGIPSVGRTSYTQDGSWAHHQPMSSEAYDQPPPVRYDTVAPLLASSSLPPEQGTLTVKEHRERHQQPMHQTYDGAARMGNSDQGTIARREHREGLRQQTYDGAENMRNSDQTGESWHSGRSVDEVRGNSAPMREAGTTGGGRVGHDGVPPKQGQERVSSIGVHGVGKGHYRNSYGGVSVSTDYPTLTIQSHVPMLNGTDNFGIDRPALNGGGISQESKIAGSRQGSYVPGGPVEPGERKEHCRYEEAEIDDNPKRNGYSGEDSRGIESHLQGNSSRLPEHCMNNALKGAGSESQMDTSGRSLYQGGGFDVSRSNTSKRSELSYHTSQSSRLSHYDDGHSGQFQPLPETDDLSLSEHPLNTTGQSLGDISQRLGKEEDRRHLLQHYLKELLDQATLPGQSKSLPTRPQTGEVPHTQAGMKRSSNHQSHVVRNQVVSHQTSLSSAPQRHRPASNSPIQRDIVPVKERTVPKKEDTNKSGRSSAENSSRSSQRLSDESRGGRRSANSSVLHGRSQPNKEQSMFGTSTPKKKGAPRSIKPPTRKVKPGKPKPGIWK